MTAVGTDRPDRNTKVYIHEFIDITKQNRARYMQHMTANWSPIAQEQRDQLCYGVWGVLGSTGGWPMTVNMWEEDGFAGLAESFALETGSPTQQDPALAKWWASAAELRSGGVDRIVVPHPGSRTIGQLCADGAGGAVYAHELCTVEPGTVRDVVASAWDESAGAPDGWRLIGAFWTAMKHDSELLLLWAVDSWQVWGEVEGRLAAGEVALLPEAARSFLSRDRILLVDAPLSPLRTGRQPAREDRTDWED